MIWITGMIEDCDAEYLVPKWALDVAPRGALLFALPVTQSICVEMGLARIGFVPGHPHGQPADKKFAELNLTFFGAQQKIEIDHIRVARLGRMNRDPVFLLQYYAPVRRYQFHQRAPGDTVRCP